MIPYKKTKTRRAAKQVELSSTARFGSLPFNPAAGRARATQAHETQIRIEEDALCGKCNYHHVTLTCCGHEDHTESRNLEMKPKANGSIKRTQQPMHVQGEGPNWVLIVGGALLSTLSIRIGCRIKQAFDAKQPNNAHNTLKENGKRTSQRRSGACEVHSNIYCFPQDEEGCYRCLSGNLNGMMDTPNSPTSRDRLEPTLKPFHHSNSSDSPYFSESGSDISSKREAIQKLRQQLKRRDEMIMEMQAQITDLQNSLNVQMSHSSHLQSQRDSANQDLFDSEGEIQRLRKVTADHCVAEAISPERPNWQPEAMKMAR